MSDSKNPASYTMVNGAIYNEDLIPKFVPNVKITDVIQVGNTRVLAREAFNAGCYDAIKAQGKAFMTQLLRYDRSIMGDSFNDEFLEIKRKNREKLLKNWLVTINFPDADGDPWWCPVNKRGFNKSSIHQKLTRFSINAPFGQFSWAYEWSEVLHVHIALTWIEPGSQDTILKYFFKSFKSYVSNHKPNIDVKAFRDGTPIAYLEKWSSKYPERQEDLEYYKQQRSLYGVEDLYCKAGVCKKSKKTEKNNDDDE